MEVLRGIAGCGEDLSRENFEKMWYWLYPVAFSLSKNPICNLWECVNPLWIEGFITKEEAENSLRGPKGLQNPGTFVLRFPTSRSWPHPDAGSLVITYVGADSTLHHKLLSLDLRYVRLCVEVNLSVPTLCGAFVFHLKENYIFLSQLRESMEIGLQDIFLYFNFHNKGNLLVLFVSL